MTLRLVCVATLLLLSTQIASARVVMIRPSIARSCPGTKRWDTTQSCITRFGKIVDVRTRPDLHLFKVVPSEDAGIGEGLYLYTSSQGSWHLSGMIIGEALRVTDLSSLSIHKQRVWRIDYTYASSDEISTDGETSRPSHIRSRHVAFCAAGTAMCSVVMTACDVFVEGRLLWTFHGTLVTDADGSVHVSGDRSRVGDRCEQEQNSFMPVSTEEE